MLALWLLVAQPVSGLLRARRPAPLLVRYRRSVVRQWLLAAVAGSSRCSGSGRRCPGRSLLDALLRPTAVLLATSRRERWAYAGVAVTAGFAEELLYRGWLPWFLVLAAGQLQRRRAPQRGGVRSGARLPGARVVLLAGLAGLGLGLLALSTGSLLLPVLLHALVDLRVLLLLPSRRALRPAPAAR